MIFHSYVEFTRLNFHLFKWWLPWVFEHNLNLEGLSTIVSKSAGNRRLLASWSNAWDTHVILSRAPYLSPYAIDLASITVSKTGLLVWNCVWLCVPNFEMLGMIVPVLIYGHWPPRRSHLVEEHSRNWPLIYSKFLYQRGHTSHVKPCQTHWRAVKNMCRCWWLWYLVGGLEHEFYFSISWE